eukprot:TRINITY_DN1262_c0_g1_i1.p1 TRINITY_DN1262_c0_g1~~TRINITY_DN1262_c0_g1_i1.p1  ORF type:complete len:483 (+),score=49.70 TRINITY_DN1262_c0_g1_i1:236-1684(+)
MFRVRMLLHFKVIPLIVFDGNRLPMKQLTEEQRRKNRDEHRAKGFEELRNDRLASAIDHFQKAVDITPEMAARLCEELRRENVEFVVAPYEADAQLAFLALNGLVDAVITEDSDLLAYGCPCVLYKMDKEGQCKQIVLEQLGQVEEAGVSFANWTMDMFLEFCILSGCDFLVSPPGMGVKTANRLIRRYRCFQRAVEEIKREFSVAADYEVKFQQAFFTFKHQRVFDIQRKMVQHLHPLPEGAAETDLSFLGPELDVTCAREVAAGLRDPITGQLFPVSAATVVLESTATRITAVSRKRSAQPLAVERSGISRYFIRQSEASRRPFVMPRRSEVTQERVNTDITSIANYYEENSPAPVAPSTIVASKYFRSAQTASTPSKTPMKVLQSPLVASGQLELCNRRVPPSSKSGAAVIRAIAGKREREPVLNRIIIQDSEDEMTQHDNVSTIIQEIAPKRSDAILAPGLDLDGSLSPKNTLNWSFG